MKFKKLKAFASSVLIFAFIFTASAADELYAVGRTAGIRLMSDGAIITEIPDSGAPAHAAGLREGDIVKKASGKEIFSNIDLKNAVNASGGKPLKIEYVRNGKTYTAEVCPENTGGEYAIGCRVRDSIAGIGTITFYDGDTKTYGALGHAICDIDTDVIIPAESGELLQSYVSGVTRGEAGSPGELLGDYDFSEKLADIQKNTESGIFGKMVCDDIIKNAKKYPVAKKEEVKRGKAKILANIEGDKVEAYDIEISDVYSDGDKTKNMLITATDGRLLNKTGGIVRGMSGSPVIQNGKLIGAVTHVLINDPTRGYGIFIENMLE